MLMHEASETGEHSLKRALGPINLITLGIGAIIGAGIFVLTGSAAAKYAGPAIVLSFVLSRNCLRFCRTLLRRVRLADPHRRLGLHLWLRHPGRDLRLDHRLGPDPGICLRRGHRGFRLERLCAQLPGGLRHSHPPATDACAQREARLLRRPLGAPGAHEGYARGPAHQSRHLAAADRPVQPGGVPRHRWRHHPAGHRHQGVGQLQFRNRDREGGDRADVHRHCRPVCA